MALFLIIGACTGGDSVQRACLEAVGQLHASIEDYNHLLDSGVQQMRDEGAVEKLEGISEEYSELLDVLEARKTELPEDIQRAHDLFVSGVGLQVSAWMSISDGLRFNNTDLIEDAAEMITLSRDVVAESEMAIPDCIAVSD